MKKLCFLLAMVSIFLTACSEPKQTGQSESSSQTENSSLLETDKKEENTPMEGKIVFGDIKVIDPGCELGNPMKLKIEMDSTEFDLKNVQILLSYAVDELSGAFFGSDVGLTIYNVDNMDKLYKKYCPEGNQTEPYLYYTLEEGIYEDGLYYVNKLTEEEMQSQEYRWSGSVGAPIVYNHAEMVTVPAQLFTGDSGQIHFYFWSGCFFNEEDEAYEMVQEESYTLGTMRIIVFDYQRDNEKIILTEGELK